MVRRERTWIEISASAVRHNLRSFQRLTGARVGIMPIIKANAYGHGLAEVAKLLKREHSAAFGVAYGEEALRLRALGYRGRIVVLSSWQTNDLIELIKQQVELVVWDWISWRNVTATAQRCKTKPKIHLKVDTGTSRIGFLPSEIKILQRRLASNTSLSIVGIFSHFANAEEVSTSRTKNQLKRFTTLDKELGLPERVERHIACTAAIVRYPEAYFTVVRLGIGLYGLWPSDAIYNWARAHKPEINLKPVLAWKTRLRQIKTVPKGTGIGYGSTMIAKRPLRIGIVPIGYSDGLDRRLSNTGWMIVRGQRAAIIGRVSMNLAMINLSTIDRAVTGDPVTIIGPGISLLDWSQSSHALTYELMARLNPAIPRVIV